MYRIGVDVGGTNTDAVILDVGAIDSPSRGVLTSCKRSTTRDVTSGIKNVIGDVLATSKVDRDRVLSVAIGTTHFINAVLEEDPNRLARVAVVRLCGPFTRELPPFAGFPPSLRAIMEGPTFYLDGGLEIDGREIAALDTQQIKDTVDAIKKAGFIMVAVVGVFSAIDHDGQHEDRCKSMMLEHDPSLDIVCSHAIGGVGLVERENATILNASILPLARETVRGFRMAMKDLDLPCPLFLTQNDGTLTDAATAAELPIKTFASGQTNSMTGAAFLAGLDKGDRIESKNQILVVDIGGTSTDVCALLRSGFPRQAPSFVDVGGVRTAFSMPEVVSIGLGGGSIVKVGDSTSEVSVGPESVGHQILSKAIVFGGDVMTATDIVSASGQTALGDVERVKASVSGTLLDNVRQRIKQMLEGIVEEMKVSSAPVTVLLVGGGSIVQMDELQGVVECIRPPHHDSANAVGAAIAKVAGEVDLIEILENKDEKAVLKTVEEKAIALAIEKGADKNKTTIVQVEKFPLQYASNKATRIVVKAVGPLVQPEEMTKFTQVSYDAGSVDENDEQALTRSKPLYSASQSTFSAKPSQYMDLETYRPDVRDGVWYISAVDLEFIACGNGILGTGGGGPTYIQYLVSLESLHRGGSGKMRVVGLDSLADNDVCAFGSWYGAPSVSGERISGGQEIVDAIKCVAKLTGYNDFNAVVADEIGGGNGLSTFPTSVYFDRPVVDADLMGRAYPTMEHGTPYVYGAPITPCAIADARGNVSVLMSAESNTRVEKMLRCGSIELGLNVAVAARPLDASIIKKYAIPKTYSQSWYLGRAVHQARRAKTSVPKKIFEITPGRVLYTGKIIEVKRDISRGYTVGKCVIRPLSAQEKDEDDEAEEGSCETRNLVIPFQNEFLYATYVDPTDQDAKEEVICTVPDLISMLGQDGEAIGSQDLRFGLKVKVIGMPAHPLWTQDERGLKIGGPKYFGLDMEWVSLGQYQEPRSVIEEFDTKA